MKAWKISVVLTVLLVSTNSLAAGSVTGTVKFEGTPPALKEIKMDADPVCVANNNNQTVKSDALVLGAGNTMGNIFVRVKSGLPAGKTYTAPTEPVVIDQHGCFYKPHVMGVMVGQPVKILNSDGTLHNLHGLGKVNAEFNEAMPKFKKELTKTFDKEEFLIPVKCDVHPWMQAYIGVSSHPFFAVTKDDGKFSIANLEPGKYEIEAWHEKLGAQVQTIEVKDGAPATLDFTFKMQ